MSDETYDGVESVFNEEHTRCLRAVPMGIAAYEGWEYRPGQWRGRHVGLFDDGEAAESWLLTGEPKPKPLPEYRQVRQLK